MRRSITLPLVVFALALSFGAWGAYLLVMSRVPTPSPASTTTVTSAADDARTVAAVEAKVQKSQELELHFELARVPAQNDAGTYVFVRPIGWKPIQEDRPSLLVADESHGIFSTLSVSSSRDGACPDTGCASLVDEDVQKELQRGFRADEAHEARAPGNRVVVWVTTSGVAYVSAWWFEPGARRYHACRAYLGGALVPYLDAFLEICRTARVER